MFQATLWLIHHLLRKHTCFVKLKNKQLVCWKTLSTCLCFPSSLLISSFLSELLMEGLQSIVCFEMACVSLAL